MDLLTRLVDWFKVDASTDDDSSDGVQPRSNTPRSDNLAVARWGDQRREHTTSTEIYRVTGPNFTLSQDESDSVGANRATLDARLRGYSVSIHENAGPQVRQNSTTECHEYEVLDDGTFRGWLYNYEEDWTRKFGEIHSSVVEEEFVVTGDWSVEEIGSVDVTTWSDDVHYRHPVSGDNHGLCDVFSLIRTTDHGYRVETNRND